MERRDLLRLARIVTRLAKEQDRHAGYLRTVDLLTHIDREADDASLSVVVDPGPGPDGLQTRPPPSEFLRRALRELSEATGAALDPPLVVSALTRPVHSAPPVLWPEGPPAGVYLTSSWKAAQAAIARFTGATHAAASFTDWVRLVGPTTVDLQPSQDYIRFHPRNNRAHPEPSGIFRARLASEPSGTLFVAGLLPFSAHEWFQTAEKLHEGCLLAAEYGHRVVAVIRTPRPQDLVRDLLQSMDIPEYYDAEYVHAALRGIVANDGRLLVGVPVATALLPPNQLAQSPKRARRRAPQTVFVHRPSLQTTRPTGSSLLAFSTDTTRTRSLTPEATGFNKPLTRTHPTFERDNPWTTFLSQEEAFAVPSRASREAALAISAGSIVQRVAAPHMRAAEEGGTSPELPPELATLLVQGIARRDTGLLLLGGRRESLERRRLLTQSLAATESAGPAALVLPAYELGSADRYLRLNEANDGMELVSSRGCPQLPLYSSFASAYTSGYRRIVMEYECPPYLPLSLEVLDHHADEVCFIVCVNGIDTQRTFERVTRGDWHALESLIGVLAWDRLQGPGAPITVCDAFVPTDRSVNATHYASASAALHWARQLQWEAQALNQLNAHTAEAAQLRELLLASGALGSEDAEGIRQAARPEGLRVFLLEHLLAWNKVSAPGLSLQSQYH